MSGSASLGALVVSLEGNIASFQDALTKAEALSQKSMKSISSSVETAKMALESLGAAVAVEQFVEMGRKAIEAGVQLNELSERTGASVESLSTLKYAGQLTGVSLEALATGMKKLAVNMMDSLNNPSAKAAQAFKALGISVTDDVTGKLKTADQALLEIADKFSKMENGAGKAAIAVALGGKTFDAAIPLLNKGGDAIKAMGIEADKLGLKFGTELAHQMKEFDDNLIKLQSHLGKDIAKTFVPALSDITAHMIEARKEGGLFLEVLMGIGAAVVKAFGGEINPLKMAQNDAKQAFQDLAEAKQKLSDANKGEQIKFFDDRTVSLAEAIRLKLLSVTEAQKGVEDAQKRLTAAIQRTSAMTKEAADNSGNPKQKEASPIFGGKDNSDKAEAWLGSLRNQLNGAMGDTTVFGKVMEAVTTGAAKDYDQATKNIAISLAHQIDAQKEVNAELAHTQTALMRADEAYIKNAKSIADLTLKEKLAVDTVRDKTASLGLNPDAMAKMAEMQRIQKAAETEIKKITDEGTKGGIDPSLIKAQVANVKALAEAWKKDMGDAMDDQIAKSRAWDTGVSSALNDYIRMSGDAAAQANRLFTGAFKGMEDALVSFTKTGKMDFKSLADSIITELIRMQVQANVIGPLAKIFGIGGGSGSLVGGTGPMPDGSVTSSGTVAGWLSNLVPKFDVGTDYVPHDMLAMIHQGEKIIPASQNTGQDDGMAFHFAIDARGADAGVEQRIQAGVRQAVQMSVAAVQSSFKRGQPLARAARTA